MRSPAENRKPRSRDRYALGRYVVALDDKQGDAVERLARENDRSVPLQLRALIRYALRHQYQIETLETKEPRDSHD